MGYYLLTAPELDTPRRPHCPEFEGPIVGLPPLTESMEAKLFHLRDKWVGLFIAILNVDDGDVPREWAIEWLDSSGTFPTTHDQLAMDVTIPENIKRPALACMDAWHAL